MRYFQFAFVAALGALAFAGLAQILLSLLPVPSPQELTDCQDTAMVLSLDKSFSMVEDGSQSLEKVREAVAQFVKGAQEDPCLTTKEFALLTFTDQGDLDIPLGRDLSGFNRVISELNPVLGDTTVIEAGVIEAVNELNRSNAGNKILFLLTDAENFGSNAENLENALLDVRQSNIQMFTIVTNEGPHVDVFRRILGSENVQKTEEEAIGSSFFAVAEKEVLKNSVIVLNPNQNLVAWQRYFSTGLFTGLISVGIALFLMLFLNFHNKRKRLLGLKEWLLVLVSLALGGLTGVIVQYLFEGWATTMTDNASYWQNTLLQIIIWSVIGLLLALSLAGFKVLPNLKLINTAVFGLIGGALAGFLYYASFAALNESNFSFLPALIGSASLGLSFGLVLALLTQTSAQFPIWLRVFYTSDKVYRYHPIGTTPITLGTNPDADIYVQGNEGKLWQFWVEDSNVKVKNFLSDKTRSLGFKEIVSRGAIELKGMTIKVVDDRGPEKGKTNNETS